MIAVAVWGRWIHESTLRRFLGLKRSYFSTPSNVGEKYSFIYWIPGSDATELYKEILSMTPEYWPEDMIRGMVRYWTMNRHQLDNFLEAFR